MKTKPIINELNFQKVNKQQLTLNRTKPQAFRVHPSQYSNKSNKNIESLETATRSMEQCLEMLELQIQQEKVMDRDICFKIKKYLLQLKVRCQSQEEDEGDGKEEEQEQHSSPLVRKGSNKAFMRPRLELTEEARCKENLWFCGDNNTIQHRKVRANKLRNYKQNKQNNQKQTLMLEDRIKQLTSKLQQYETNFQMLNNEIKQLKTQLQAQTHQKNQLSLKLFISYSEKKQSEGYLQSCVEDANHKMQQFQKKQNILMQQLLDRQREIVNLWQMLNK